MHLWQTILVVIIHANNCLDTLEILLKSRAFGWGSWAMGSSAVFGRAEFRTGSGLELAC
jgi:hypothetical protein